MPSPEQVAAGRDGDAGVACKVLRLAFVLTGAEVERLLQPDRDQRRNVRPTFRVQRRHPVDLGLSQAPARLGPGHRAGARAAEPLVQLGGGHCSGHCFAPSYLLPMPRWGLRSALVHSPPSFGDRPDRARVMAGIGGSWHSTRKSGVRLRGRRRKSEWDDPSPYWELMVVLVVQRRSGADLCGSLFERQRKDGGCS
jgi:hypothetical protein